MGIMRSRDVCTSLGGRGADSRRGFNTAGKNMQLKTRYDGKLPVALSDWRFVCEHRSDGLRCNYNLSILLAFFLVKNINRLRHLLQTKAATPELRVISLHCKLRLYQNCHGSHYCDRGICEPVYLASGIP
jgi:hypothetical protein